ncbi:MAG: hypothetical protein KAS32_01090 [Candidatus Peribacteraceae bacterium]|nr:hypothetical protein [Candidatus Peribacteraceae bacterium]
MKAERVDLRDKVNILDPALENEEGLAEQFNRVMEWLQESENAVSETIYRTEADEDYRFYAGDQDTVMVKATLADAKRPNSTFNEVKPKIDMLIGLAAQVKYDGYVVPVGDEDEPLAELMQGTMLHYRKKLKMGRKELDCFEHSTKSGRSLLYFRIDTSNPYKPKVVPTRVPGYNFTVDPASLEYDLSDAKYLFIWAWIDEEDVKGIDPDIDITQLSNETGGIGMPTFYDTMTGKYRIATCWYRHWELKYHIINPFTNEMEALTKRQYVEFNKAAMAGIEMEDGEPLKIDEPVPYTKGYAVTYKYMTFSGSYLLDAGNSPHKDAVEFPAVLYGAYKDDNNNRWFSAITVQKDPQRSMNVMRRQLVHLLQTLPKGILMHETGAIVDIEEYEQKSSNPNYHMEVQKGMLEKIKFEKQPTISNLYERLDEVMRSSMKDSSGINDDLMGAYTSSREPGVTVSLRKESNLAVLFILFNNYRESRLSGNRKLLYLIQQYSTEKEIIRILGDKGAELIAINSQLNPQVEGWNDITACEFDLEMEETVETTTYRTAVAEMLTDLNHNNPGSIPLDVIMDYMNLPFTTKRRIREYWEEQQRVEQENKDADRALELLKINTKADGDVRVKEATDKSEVAKLKKSG